MGSVSDTMAKVLEAFDVKNADAVRQSGKSDTEAGIKTTTATEGLGYEPLKLPPAVVLDPTSV